MGWENRIRQLFQNDWTVICSVWKSSPINFQCCTCADLDLDPVRSLQSGITTLYLPNYRTYVRTYIHTSMRRRSVHFVRSRETESLSVWVVFFSSFFLCSTITLYVRILRNSCCLRKLKKRVEKITLVLFSSFSNWSGWSCIRDATVFCLAKPPFNLLH